MVVRNSIVSITECALSDNDHRIDSVVVGIGGVFGREGAEIFINNSEIINNGWDGMALYRGASAIIKDCIIKKGRGAGIGVTWDAHCLAIRNQISEFWKGIGSFGTSTVIAHNNLVYDNLGWGIIGTGESFMDAANNVVYHNGNCGVAPWSQECRGKFVNNIIVNNGWREEWVCPCVGIWNYGNLNNWDFYNNLIWNNEAGNIKDMPDINGKNGNISIDPLFVGEGDFHLLPDSPAINAGYKEITDTDGSPSDLGIYGGTSGR
ncbi:MAG: right-handed parallel beta-helix repeat-containing protein [Candidatus Zixiibacteriota bacterium]